MAAPGQPFCAWIDGPQASRVDFPSVARDVMTEIRAILDRELPPLAPRTQVVAALSRGDCVYQREGERITMLLGPAMNDLQRLARSSTHPEDTLVVEARIAPQPP